MLIRQKVKQNAFEPDFEYPYNLRKDDFALAMQDLYDFLYDVNSILLEKGLGRLEDMLRPAIYTGVLSELMTEYLAKHSRSLTVNKYPNGHPDLIKKGIYLHNKIKSGEEGIEIKCTVKQSGAVDMHGARDQNLCVFSYVTDVETEPVKERTPTKFTKIYLATVKTSDFRKNSRGELGTRTATLDRDGIKTLRNGLLYNDES
jgi:hypothetical protein